MCGTLQVLIAKRLVVLPSVWRSLAGLRPAFGAFGPGTAADKTLYRLHALVPQMITFPTHLGIYIISQLPEFALWCGDSLAVFINIFEWFIPAFIK